MGSGQAPRGIDAGTTQVPWASGFENLPVGFTVVELPDAYYTNRASIAIRRSSTAMWEPERSVNQSLYADRIKALWEWSQRYGYVLIGTNYTSSLLTCDDFEAVRFPSFPTQFFVVPAAVQDEHWVVDLTFDGIRLTANNVTVQCTRCSHTHYYGTVVCPETEEFITCPNCQTYPASDAQILSQPVRNHHAFGCESCARRCSLEECNRLTHMIYCTEHGERSECYNCGTLFEYTQATPPLIYQGRTFCTHCAERYCTGCNRFSDSRLGWSSHHGANVCTRCRTAVFRQSSEEFDEEETTIGTLVTLPGRENIRACGVEIEGGNGTGNGGNLAHELYRVNLSSIYTMVDHQSGERYGTVHVERDSSVDWEVVIGPLNMARAEEARTLDGVVKTIRTLVRDKVLTLDLRCGLHVHVSAAKVGLHQAYNLSHLFTYLEDPFFRIAAAKWPYHRASQGSHYCAPIPKFNRKLEFYNSRGGVPSGRENHYFALSFSNYFNAKLRNCQCGAVGAGVWDECTCPGLGKCTFEFRLFNTTANPKKVLAYVALCQALVAKAISMEEIARPHDEYPGLEFNRTVFRDMSADDQRNLVADWRPRLAFILNELPLTTEEKEAVLYCIRNSEIDQGLSIEEVKDLMETQEVAN